MHKFYPTLCASQRSKYELVLAEHPNAITIITSDEKTGRRFGNASKRAGECVKIGSGGRNRGEKGYQIWASWSAADIAECKNNTINSLS